MPTIRIDDDVYQWLQSKARAFEDSPNSVLRRVAGLTAPTDAAKPRSDAPTTAMRTRGEKVTGELLAKRWGVTVRHALYHRDGTFYENLDRFPGALFDPNGYVIFNTANEYKRSGHLRIGEKLNVPGGISTIPGYMRVV
jgi:hypothetical protein